MKRLTELTLGVLLLLAAVVLATAEAHGALPGTAQRQLLQVPPRKQGLQYKEEGLRSAPNNTRRGYSTARSRANAVRNLGASSDAKRIAEAACNSTNILDSECVDVLLLALTPTSYSSNNSADTPGRRFFIGPAQDQGACSACVGFAVTAAAEAAINVNKQQNWGRLSLSEQDLSFCRVLPRIDCISGASFTDVVSSIFRGDVKAWAARSCHPYTGVGTTLCPSADKCSSQLPGNISLSWAYNANALGSMGKVKQQIMLSGGVIASMAMSSDAFEQFQTYGAAGDAVYSPIEGLAGAQFPEMHAVFCYGWWDNPANVDDGWWLCKNSWGPNWGLKGSFKIAYGAAYIMQPDYTFALKVSEGASHVQQRIAQGLAYSAKPGCLQYVPKQPERLMRLADDLATLTALVSIPGVALPQVLAELVTSNLGRVRNLSAAGRGPFRLCGSNLARLLKKVACSSPAQRLPDAQPWRDCKPALGSVCEARCTDDTKGRGYTAACTMVDGAATWQITGGCPGVGAVKVRADPSLCVTVEGDVQQVKLRSCSSSLSKFQQFEYKQGNIGLPGTNTCLGVAGGSSADGSQVVAWWCDGSFNQRWWKDADGLLHPLHAPQSCLDVNPYNVKEGEPVQLWQCSRPQGEQTGWKNSGQQFTADFMPSLGGRSGFVPLKADTNLCISAPAPLAWQLQAELQRCSDSPRLLYDTDGSLRLEDTPFCLDVYSYGVTNGSEVLLWGCNGAANQRWWRDADGALRPIHAQHILPLCLTVASGDIRPGAKLQMYECNQSKAQLFAADIAPPTPTPAYLGCFNNLASNGSTALPVVMRDEISPNNNVTEECWRLAAAGIGLSPTAAHPLFGISGRTCYVGKDLAQATRLGAARESACASYDANVVALYQSVEPGGPIPRGCVLDEGTFRKDLPIEENFHGTLSGAFATARAFTLMKGAKYFAVARNGEGRGYGFTFGEEPTIRPLLNFTINGSPGCYTPCADDASKACGSGDGFGGATTPRVWFVYEFPW